MERYGKKAYEKPRIKQNKLLLSSHNHGSRKNGLLIKVKYTKTHVGHDCELGRLSLTTSDRLKIASKINAKIPFDAILDEVRSSVNENLKRIDLLTRKDLFNIERDFNLNKDSVRHANDAQSVDCWVKEMCETGDTIVRLYKSQGMLCEEHPSLHVNDFALVLMTDAQKEILKLFGNNIICIDGTHGTNAYDFELTTIMTIFADIRIQPKTFMSDMADNYYNAWLNVMIPVDHRLYCCWHVDRAWRKNLVKIKNQEKRVEVYKGLRTLLEEIDEKAFGLMLDSFSLKLNLDPETKDFGVYFQMFSKKDIYKRWAYCCRLYAGVNTNMHLERKCKIFEKWYGLLNVL
ncbi:uncharacterized protein LOC112128091 [Cimex lectularius]|uniref:MULE transposase domain-containing protein n=1 Tax=Cimex lectularius TaxID=79782 RepID=A0A8I6SP52_CIMLE|nr:uncharacterized protein LOC112128091 [Cimex lectularius]